MLNRSLPRFAFVALVGLALSGVGPASAQPVAGTVSSTPVVASADPSARTKPKRLKVTLKSKKKGRYHAKQTLTARVAGKPAGTVRFYVTHSNGWPARTTTIGHVKLRKGVAKLVWNPKASLARKTEVKKVTAQFIPKSKKFRKSSKSRPMTLSAHPTTTKVKVKGKKVHITVRGGDRKPSGVARVHAHASEAPSQMFTVKIKKGKGSFKLSRLPDGFWTFHTIFEGDSNNLAYQTWTDSFADGPRNVKAGIKDHVGLSAGWPRYGPKPDPYPVTITLSGPVRTPTGDVELGYHVDGKWKSWTATLDSTGTATFQTKHAPGAVWRASYEGDKYHFPFVTPFLLID